MLHSETETETLKPCKINFDDVPWQDFSDDTSRFGSEDKLLTAETRAQKLDACLTRLAPGKANCPYHFHHASEELFIVLEGRGKLRMDDREVEIGHRDVIACPPDPSGAHQIINDGTEPLVYLAISIETPLDVCEYPDSDKVGVFIAGAPREFRNRIFKCGSQVSYLEGE